MFEFPCQMQLFYLLTAYTVSHKQPGVGGFGAVYEARHLEDDTEVSKNLSSKQFDFALSYLHTFVISFYCLQALSLYLFCPGWI